MKQKNGAHVNDSRASLCVKKDTGERPLKDDGELINK
jgi:hypothetical protein